MAAAPNPPELIGESPAFLDALAHASSAAVLNRSLLIIGERGSGKELIAGRIHFLSPRWEGPFIKVNCAALSDDLLESELFGHEAGAFTGAQRRHTGRFERAEAGTLFLDEIASASGRVQEKLLRVIEYGEYERVGGEQTLIADVRVIAATNVDLPASAVQGGFRADLLDRLAFDVVAAPPLRARREDILLLAAHFGNGMANELDARFEGFSSKAAAAFLSHDWPGNVRELKNAAERSVYRWLAAGMSGSIGEIMIDPFAVDHPLLAGLHTSAEATDQAGNPPAPDEKKKQSLPDRIDLFAEKIDLRKRLGDLERLAVEDALLQHASNQARAAKSLGLTYDQMRGLVRKHGLNVRRTHSRKKAAKRG